MVRQPAQQMTRPSAKLLKWYDRRRRVLPWRPAPGDRADPYHVWLSEIMLQQTTVATVGRYFAEFLEKWPTVGDLAAAKLDEVLHAWQGLGYYARARNLHKCAQVVAGELNGAFPDTEARLLKLPGVGPYTAGAIAAIAFNRPASPVDGNIERVVARLFAVDEELPAAKSRIRELARGLTPKKRPGDHVQAAMDLGAAVCTPKKPACAICPLSADCAAFAAGEPETYPRKPPKAERPTRRGYAYWISDGNGSILLRRRAEEGLLGGMMEVPSSIWEEGDWQSDKALAAAPLRAPRELPGMVRHTFTHFHLELRVLAGRSKGKPDGVWCPVDRFGDHALPTVMKKVVRHALNHTG